MKTIKCPECGKDTTIVEWGNTAYSFEVEEFKLSPNVGVVPVTYNLASGRWVDNDDVTCYVSKCCEAVVGGV